MFNKQAGIVAFIKELHGNQLFTPLHAPVFSAKEKEYLANCIDTTFVSYLGEYVGLFEQKLAEYTGAKYAIAVVNGTSALHIALLLAEVQPGDEVITQALTFVATPNAISYTGANPVFIDVNKETMGLCPEALSNFLNQYCVRKPDGYTYNKISNKRIKACVPMHTFGFPVYIENIKNICDEYNIALIEDSAESLGSYIKGRHTGTWGLCSIFSFNGNKTITCGAGGAIITDNEALAQKAKYLTTTAKKAHPWEFFHDQTGYNYRMSNVNAAIGCAQFEKIEEILTSKRLTALKYSRFFNELGISFVSEREDTKVNYWLNTILLDNKEQRDNFLKYSNSNGVMTRPIWELMTTLPMYNRCMHDELTNSKWLSERIVNLPSSAIL